MPRTRTNSWHSSAVAVSTTVSSLSTDDVLSSVMTVPMPVIHLVFGGKAHGSLSLSGAATPARRTGQPARPIPDSAGPYCWVDAEPPAPAHPYRIELSIDSLPNHLLVEPIPVAIDPVGDTAYTAWVPNLDTNATGSSVFEALLLLKERIEAVYDDLNKRAHLTNDQKMTLQMLHTYIAPSSTKAQWV